MMVPDGEDEAGLADVIQETLAWLASHDIYPAPPPAPPPLDPLPKRPPRDIVVQD